MKRRIALLADLSWSGAGSTADHIAAFSRHSRHQIIPLDPRLWRRGLGFDLRGFDAVALHYTLRPEDPNYLPPAIAEAVSRFSGHKLQYRQDEYRNVNGAVAMMEYLGIGTLFTVVPTADMARVYPHAAFRKITLVPTLTGYVSERLASAVRPPVEKRSIHLGYRARETAYWLGHLGREKTLIAEGVNARAASVGLACDVSYRIEDRIYGADWLRFLGGCRGFLGTESGASIVDFDGSIETACDSYLAQHPGATYGQVHDAILAPHEGRVVIHTVGPRVFECAALGAAMVQFPGDHGGVVQPWRHYIPLEKDFSNMDEVAQALKDDAFLSTMTEQAHADLIRSGQYALSRMVQAFDDEIDRRAPIRLVPVRWGAVARTRLAGAAKLDRVLDAAHSKFTRMTRLFRLALLAVTHAGPALSARFVSRAGVAGLAELGRLALLLAATPARVGDGQVSGVVAWRDGTTLVLSPASPPAHPKLPGDLPLQDVTAVVWRCDRLENQVQLIEEVEYGFKVLETFGKGHVGNIVSKIMKSPA